MFLNATFIILLCHEGSAGTSRTSINGVIAKLLGSGGARAIVADSPLKKHQLLIINRSRRRTLNLATIDRMLLGFWSLFLSPPDILQTAVTIKPSTLLNFHDKLKRLKYRLLSTTHRKGKPGPKELSQELIDAIVELKRRNSRFGCPRIAHQINKAFGVNIYKDVVRRTFAKHCRLGPDSDNGPSWLTSIGHLKDSLWSINLFRCESILLNTHWVLVVVKQFTRQIIEFGVHAGNVNGITLCDMFNRAPATTGTPKYTSSDNDPLFQCYR